MPERGVRPVKIAIHPFAEQFLTLFKGKIWPWRKNPYIFKTEKIIHS